MSALIEDLAERLDRAVRTGVPIPQLSAEGELSLADAYAVQRAGVALRTSRGERVSGAKLGFTSKAKAEQMGVSDVIIGALTDAMAVPAGASLDLTRSIHPRVEPEIAFLLGADVDPADPDADLTAAITHVAPALEVIDSRYRDFRFSLADVVADNTSASAYAVGDWVPVERVRAGIDLAGLEVVLSVDGAEAARGSSADILGDPWAALPATLRMAARHGQALRRGGVLLAGAATAAVPLPAGARVTATVAGLGDVGLLTEGAR
ncbi:fumarylacetoacetate hydrolase family protein [Nocardioides sp. LHD-245]|uniref:2-keto-4-pentenoate hydratase n=1 Tax=Nocardioides sp. LHD-245 TaxID=3051387 RepID=UPI0027E0FBDB|nr:fumarylacetoacetate hydrolase family protein [Nocardioides sp. LHD-245]